jgi:hypothetical protein
VRALVELGECAATFAGEGEVGAATVSGGLAALDEPALLEGAEHATEVAGVEPELPGDAGGRRAVRMGELVQHAHLGKGEIALEQSFLEDADLLREEAIEPANVGDACVESGVGHGGSLEGRASQAVGESIAN